MTTASDTTSLNIALLGGGTVGSQVARILIEDGDSLSERIGAKLNLTGIFVRNPQATRDYHLPSEYYVYRSADVMDGAGSVIDSLGGTDPALQLDRKAI